MKKPRFTSYKRPNGHNEFEEFYYQLPKKDKQKLIATIKSIQDFGLIIATRQEWVKKLDENIYEIRSKVSSNIQRCLYFHADANQYIITHGFTKKTQKTPKREIDHAKVIKLEYDKEKGELK
ncbi:type II toxin-antitoxin system RelE/ParE family toxin [Lactobacillus sp. ESL0225]|uniref:type II toxin-antitoxin system RelE/ParE family toxin n=1 Tax=Lactobacillus sp. ESL0225 TaxID=2069351 RepID=UPI000EFC5F1C|nr:type II toxin-antitoxin system RelE/ParE family toxin [Lactobacillus sp. ESL0225]RMC47720.1 type II toxin-antitoxin system RelE/ParE family toxin [Lactobacillus sp. ESL0225]